MNPFDKKTCVSYLRNDFPNNFLDDDDSDDDSDINENDKYIKANKISFIIPFPDWKDKEHMDPFIKETFYEIEGEKIFINKISICDFKQLKNYTGSLEISIYRLYNRVDVHYMLEIYKKSMGIYFEKIFVSDLELDKELPKLIDYFGKYYYIYNMFGELMMKNTENQKITLFQLLFSKIFYK